jgi:hypothetical protein
MPSPIGAFTLPVTASVLYTARQCFRRQATRWGLASTFRLIPRNWSSVSPGKSPQFVRVDLLPCDVNITSKTNLLAPLPHDLAPGYGPTLVVSLTPRLMGGAMLRVSASIGGVIIIALVSVAQGQMAAAEEQKPTVEELMHRLDTALQRIDTLQHRVDELEGGARHTKPPATAAHHIPPKPTASQEPQPITSAEPPAPALQPAAAAAIPGLRPPEPMGHPNETGEADDALLSDPALATRIPGTQTEVIFYGFANVNGYRDFNGRNQTDAPTAQTIPLASSPADLQGGDFGLSARFSGSRQITRRHKWGI